MARLGKAERARRKANKAIVALNMSQTVPVSERSSGIQSSNDRFATAFPTSRRERSLDFDPSVSRSQLPKGHAKWRPQAGRFQPWQDVAPTGEVTVAKPDFRAGSVKGLRD